MDFFASIGAWCVGNDEKPGMPDDPKEVDDAATPALSAEQIAQCRRAFAEADGDKDGILNRSELCTICGWNEGDDEVSSFLAEFELKDDGKVDFNEFCSIMAQALLRDEQHEVAAEVDALENSN